jgi:hypothetical protein
MIRLLDFDKRQQEEMSLLRAMTGGALLDPYESKNTRKEKQKISNNRRKRE